MDQSTTGTGLVIADPHAASAARSPIAPGPEAILSSNLLDSSLRAPIRTALPSVPTLWSHLVQNGLRELVLSLWQAETGRGHAQTHDYYAVSGPWASRRAMSTGPPTGGPCSREATLRRLTALASVWSARTSQPCPDVPRGFGHVPVACVRGRVHRAVLRAHVERGLLALCDIGLPLLDLDRPGGRSRSGVVSRVLGPERLIVGPRRPVPLPNLLPVGHLRAGGHRAASSVSGDRALNHLA
jgi:hypothetical protein